MHNVVSFANGISFLLNLSSIEYLNTYSVYAPGESTWLWFPGAADEAL